MSLATIWALKELFLQYAESSSFIPLFAELFPGSARHRRAHSNWRRSPLSLPYSLSEKAVATHSSTLAWQIPWTEEPGRLQSMGSLGVGHDWSDLAASAAAYSDFTFTFHFHALEKEMATHSSVLAWRIPGTGEPSGLPSLGLHRVRHDWSDLAAAAYNL